MRTPKYDLFEKWFVAEFGVRPGMDDRNWEWAHEGALRLWLSLLIKPTEKSVARTVARRRAEEAIPLGLCEICGVRPKRNRCMRICTKCSNDLDRRPGLGDTYGPQPW